MARLKELKPVLALEARVQTRSPSWDTMDRINGRLLQRYGGEAVAVVPARNSLSGKHEAYLVPSDQKQADLFWEIFHQKYPQTPYYQFNITDSNQPPVIPLFSLQPAY